MDGKQQQWRTIQTKISDGEKDRQMGMPGGNQWQAPTFHVLPGFFTSF